MADQDIDRLVDFGEPAPLDGVAEENLVAVIMPRWIEFERALAHKLRLQIRLELGSSGFRSMPTPVRMRASASTSACV